MYDCTIVGGGPCGVACAIYLKQAGYKVVIVENELIGGQPLQTTNITNVVGFIGDGNKFGETLQEQISQNNIEVIYNEAKLVDKKLYIDNKEIETKTIVIATGATPTKLPNIYKCHYCALCDGLLYKDKIVAIIGNGNSAFTEALYLSKFCKEVNLLVSDKHRLLANETLQKQVSETNNIKVKFYDKIFQSTEHNLMLEHEKGLSEELVEYDGLFVSIGRTPNIDWIENCNEIQVDLNYNVKFNNDLEFNKNIFAGGDVIDKPIKQISTAINDGVVISQNIIKYLKENKNEN